MKPIIEDIKIDMEQLNKIMIKPDTRQRSYMIRKLVGGICTCCCGTPTKKVSYDVGDGCKLVEWYCDNCFERWVDRKRKSTR